jgi:hypothetical protein
MTPTTITSAKNQLGRESEVARDDSVSSVAVRLPVESKVCKTTVELESQKHGMIPREIKIGYSWCLRAVWVNWLRA